MDNVRTIHVDWYSQRPPRFDGGPQLAYQGDHLSNMVIFDNAPELPNYYLLVEMKTDDGGPIIALPAIQLEGPYWVIPNYYTQICQVITYQVCCKTGTNDYEHHSAKFKGTILPVITHNGEPIDQSAMFDPYKQWVSEIAMAAGAIVIDAELSSTSTNPVQNKVVKATIDGLGDDISDIHGRLEHYQKSLITSVTNGKYIVASTGGEGSNANCAVSGHIPVWHLRGNGIVISSYLWQAAGYAFYDRSGVYITGESANSLSLTVSAGQVTAHKTTVPPSAYTLRVTLHASTYVNNASKYFYTLSESDAKKWVIIGDSYATGYTPDGSTTGWVPTTMASIGLTSSDYELICEGGAGFLNGGNQSALTFEGLLDTATLGKSEVGHILVCGGYNDYSRTYAQMQTAFNSFYSAARAKYPFAKIQLGMVSYSTNSDIESALLNVTRLAFLGMNSNAGVEYLSGVEFSLSDDDMSTDGVHPKQIGATKVGMSVANAILTGSAGGKNYDSVIKEINGRLGQLSFSLDTDANGNVILVRDDLEDLSEVSF